MVPDLIKYDPRHQRHTPEALELLEREHPSKPGKVLCHEHAVPRGVLAKKAMQAAGRDEVEALFRRYCTAVIVTKVQDTMLTRHGLRERMPSAWRWGDDPFARYLHAGLAVVEPGGEGTGAERA